MARHKRLDDIIQVPGEVKGSVRQVKRLDALLELVRQGCTHRVAAVRAGISEATFYRWRDKGQKAKSGQWRDFYEQLQEAEAIAEAALTLQMRKHASTEWRANAWMLERRFKKTWGERKVVDATISSPAGQAPVGVIVGLAELDRGQLAELAGNDLDALDELKLPTEIGPGPPAPTDTDTQENDDDQADD